MRSLIRVVLLVGFAAFVAACGSELPFYGFPDATGLDATGGGDAAGTVCDTHADCPGGFVCNSGECAPVDAPVCEPGAGRCDGNVAVVCNDVGTALTRVDCGANECTAGGSGASCLNAVCVEDSVGCVDGTTRFACDGGVRTLTACGAEEGCSAGACVARICAPGTRRCVDETTGAVCGASGVAETLIQCSLVDGCDSEAGCACVSGACTPRVCAPGARACEGADVVECGADGDRYNTVETCGSGLECRGGTCVEATCTEGDTRCSGDTLLRCESGAYVDTNCAAAGQFCDASARACVPRVCQPGVTRCDVTGTARLACDARGAVETRSPCGDGEFCDAGVCAPQQCVPGTRRCNGGDVYACPASGGEFALVQRCADDETCEEGVCTGFVAECTTASDCPAPPNRCEGDVLVRHSALGNCVSGTCDYASAATRRDCASSGLTCSRSELACVSRTGTVCTSDTECAEGERCSETRCVECAGSSDCNSGDLCVDNVCVPCSCSEGFICDAAGECIEGDPTVCASDSECAELAERLSISPDSAACDSEMGCYIRGFCGDAFGGGGGDAFGATCPSGTVCALQLDLANADSTVVCTQCDPEDANSCRDGETCVIPTLAIPTNYPYCSGSGGGGFPFP